jgi:hypothetical protein
LLRVESLVPFRALRGSAVRGEGVSTRSSWRLRRYGLVLVVAAGAVPICAQSRGAGVSTPSASTPAATASSSMTSVSSIGGRVFNAATGLPVARALVRFNDRAMLTDHDGKFEFDQVTESSGDLQVTKPGYSFSIDPGDGGGIYVRADQTSKALELRLYPEALITGTITGPDGAPLPRIFIAAHRRVFEEAGGRWIQATQSVTNSHGSFRLALPAGDYRLSTHYQVPDGMSSKAILPLSVPEISSSNASDVLHLRVGEEQHLDLRPTVSSTYKVMATVDSPAEHGFPRVVARSTNGLSIPVNSPRSGVPGEVRMDLPAGTYTLTATMMGEAPEQAQTVVTVSDHDISGVVFHFAPVPSIPVELLIDQGATSDKAPPTLQQFGLMLQSTQFDPAQPDSSVRLTAQRDRGAVFSLPVGTYKFQARNNGEWFIKSVSYGSSDLLQQDLAVVPGSSGTPIRVTVTNQTASVQGTVRLNGKPGNYWLYLIASGSSAQAFFNIPTSTDGSYNYSHLPPGSYRAVAFERRHSVDYRDPATLAPYSSYVRSVMVNPGDKPMLDLDAVPVAEIAP